MSDKFLNQTGLSYYHSRIKTIFPSKTEFDALDDKVDQIIAEGGEPNVIESVKVNGTALPVTNKAVDITVPTKTSDLTNDGDGTSNFATEDYVDENGGKIDVIKVNGTSQTITNKEVDLDVPNYTATATGATIASGDGTKSITLAQSTNGYTVSGTGSSGALTSKELVDKNYVDTNAGKIDTIKVNGTVQPVTNKAVDITVPTKTSDLTNDSNFIDNTVANLTNYYDKTDTYTKTEVDELLGAIEVGKYVVVATLPTASASTMRNVYLVPQTPGSDVSDIYVTIETDNAGTKTYSWKNIGSTQINLDGYWNDTNLVAITTAEIDTLFA